jgi:hypothetical protein
MQASGPPWFDLSNPILYPRMGFSAIVLRDTNKEKSGKAYIGWFTITAMNMFAGKEIEHENIPR